MEQSATAGQRHEPWNKGKLVGQKSPLKLKDIWAVRIRLQIANRIRDLALFDLAIDSKLRACDLVRLRVQQLRPRCPLSQVAHLLLNLRQVTHHRLTGRERSDGHRSQGVRLA